ncbi:MAG: 2-C-methyl-D-erythritol 2,4-cyclodiphosphate synthase [Puniceicoccaceae bacterium]
MTALPFRTGIAYDVHRFDSARPLVLGGVTIPGGPGLAGHSDADALTHAAADAILGAIALRDIGHHFPPGDPACANIDSRRILAFAVEQAGGLGYEVANLDVMIIAETPKLAPWIDPMRTSLARTMGLTPDRIGIKATTNEGLGSIGRGEGIAALASVLLASRTSEEPTGGSRPGRR